MIFNRIKKLKSELDNANSNIRYLHEEIIKLQNQPKYKVGEKIKGNKIISIEYRKLFMHRCWVYKLYSKKKNKIIEFTESFNN